MFFTPKDVEVLRKAYKPRESAAPAHISNEASTAIVTAFQALTDAHAAQFQALDRRVSNLIVNISTLTVKVDKLVELWEPAKKPTIQAPGWNDPANGHVAGGPIK
jgi:molybdopterin-guanine dinucleotide biosynthesis protein A